MRHFAFGVDMTLLMTHFAVVTDAVGVLKLPVKSRRLPPTVKRVLSFTSLCGFMSQTILPYVIFLVAGSRPKNGGDCVGTLYVSDTLG